MSQSDDSTGGAESVVQEEGVLAKTAEVLGPGRRDEGTGAGREKGVPYVIQIPGKR